MSDVGAPAGGGIRRLVRNTAVYAVADLIAKGGAYALIPLLTRGLSAPAFGAYTLVITLVPVLTIVASMGLGGAVTRLWFDLEAHERRRFQLASFLSLQAVAAAVAIALSAATPALFGALFPRVDSSLFLFGIWASFFLASATVPLAVLRAEEKPKRFAVLSASQFLGPAAGVVVALASGAGVRGTLWGHLAGGAAVLALSIAFVAPLSERPPAWRSMRPALALGIPVVPHLIAHWALNVADRVAIQRALGTAAVGLYAVGYQIAQGVSLIATALNNATVPTFYRAAQADRHDALGRAWAPVLYGVGAFSMLVALFGEEAVRILATPQYRSSAEFIPWVALGYWLLAAYYFPVNALFYVKRVWIIPVATLTAAALNYVLNVWLLPRRGLIAAAQNTAIAYGVLFLIVLAAAQRAMRLPYGYARAAAIGALGAGIYALSTPLPGGAAGTALKVPLFALYLVAGRAIVGAELRALREPAARADAGQGDRVVLAAATTTQARTMAACTPALRAAGLHPAFVSLDPILGKAAAAGFQEAGVPYESAGAGGGGAVSIVLRGRSDARALVAGAAAVVLGNDFSAFERLMIQEARRAGCASVLVQDGVIALGGKAAGGGARSGSALVGLSKRLLSLAGFPFRPSPYGTGGCDAVCVYGPSTARALQARGVAPERIHVTGQPRYDALSGARARPEILLVTTQPFSRYGLATLEQETALFARTIREAIAEAGGREVVVKLHPDTEARSRAALQAAAGAEARFEQMRPIEPLLERAAVVITLSSTTALEAMLYGAAVVVVDAPGFPATLPYLESGAVAAARSPEQIGGAIREALAGHGSTAEARRAFLAEHLAPPDGRAAQRVATAVRAAILAVRPGDHPAGSMADR